MNILRHWIAYFKLDNMVSSMFCVFFLNKKPKTLMHLPLKTLFFSHNRMCFLYVPDSQSLSCTWISLCSKLVPQSLGCGLACLRSHPSTALLFVPWSEPMTSLTPTSGCSFYLSAAPPDASCLAKLSSQPVPGYPWLGRPGLSLSGSCPD